MALEGMDEFTSPARGRRAHHRLHVVWAGGHEGLGHGADKNARGGESRRAIYAGAQAAQSGAGISKTGAGVFAVADFVEQVPDSDGVSASLRLDHRRESLQV